MREDRTSCSWCWSVNNGDTVDWISTEDPAADLEPPPSPPKMASADRAASDADGAVARALSPTRSGHARPPDPDGGIPGHVGTLKQLHSGTGYNLVIDTEGKVYGTRVPYNSEAIMEVTARAVGEVQIKAKHSKFYLAMDDRGKTYAEVDQSSPNTWFKELYEDGWNYYLWLGNKKEWFLGINKSAIVFVYV